MHKRIAGYFITAWLLLLMALSAKGQQMVSSVPVTDRLLAVSSPQPRGEEEEFIKSSRPSVANPAEIHKACVLQIEFGYDGNFRAEEFRSQQTAPLALRFAANSRLLLEADLDTVKSETDETGMRQTGIGDTRLGLQVVALKETEQRPAVAFAYCVKLPSASKNKGLGTGRVDHKILFLLSRKFASVDMDLNGAYLIVGLEDERGWVTGGQGALSFSGEFANGFGLQGELSGQTKDDVQPKGLFALGALTYRANRRLIFDAGLRFGLNRDAPRVGVFAGLTIGAVDFREQ